MPDKNTSIQDYNSSFTKKVENALLDIWALLGEYRDDLILIGGLAPRYITAPANTKDYSLTTHCGTMDIDFGISIAVANQKKYKDIIDILHENGFNNAVNEKGNPKHHSFEKDIDGEKIIIDFLTTTYDGPEDSLMHKFSEEISAIQTEGLGLAFINPIQCHVQRVSPEKTIAEEVINVCRPVAYIVLKALAFDKRRKDKDIYDLVYVLENYKDGVSSVISEILDDDLKAESFKKSIDCLDRHFRDINYIGPVAYGNFLSNRTVIPQAFALVRDFLGQVKKMLVQ